jgi:transcriptional regulator with XRE-family HTH domain
MKHVVGNGDLIKTLRMTKGMSQGDLARVAKVGITTVRRIEQSHRTTSANLEALAKALGVSAQHVLFANSMGDKQAPPKSGLVRRVWHDPVFSKVIATAIIAIAGATATFFLYDSTVKRNVAIKAKTTAPNVNLRDQDQNRALRDHLQEASKTAVVLEQPDPTHPLRSPLVISGNAHSDEMAELGPDLIFRLIDGYGKDLVRVSVSSPDGKPWPLQPTYFEVSTRFTPTTGKAILN